LWCFTTKGESLNVYSVVYVPVSMSSSTSCMLPDEQPIICRGLGWAAQSNAPTARGGDGDGGREGDGDGGGPGDGGGGALGEGGGGGLGDGGGGAGGGQLLQDFLQQAFM
jgi:hypothetical protein